MNRFLCLQLQDAVCFGSTFDGSRLAYDVLSGNFDAAREALRQLDVETTLVDGRLITDIAMDPFPAPDWLAPDDEEKRQDNSPLSRPGVKYLLAPLQHANHDDDQTSNNGNNASRDTKQDGPDDGRNKWLFENRPTMTLPELERELTRLAPSHGWVDIGQQAIRKAIERYARARDLDVPKGPTGRPKS